MSFGTYLPISLCVVRKQVRRIEASDGDSARPIRPYHITSKLARANATGKKTTYVIFMCNNKCARVNATYKFQTYKAITLFQAKLLLHNHIHPPRSIRICSLRLPRALESPTATTCRIPQLQVSSKTIYNHLPSNRPQRQNKGCIFWMIYNELLVRSRNMSICFSFSTMLLAWTAQKNRNTKECLPKKGQA